MSESMLRIACEAMEAERPVRVARLVRRVPDRLDAHHRHRPVRVHVQGAGPDHGKRHLHVLGDDDRPRRSCRPRAHPRRNSSLASGSSLRMTSGSTSFPETEPLATLRTRRFPVLPLQAPAPVPPRGTVPAASAGRAPSCGSWTATRRTASSPWASSPGSPKVTLLTSPRRLPHETTSGVPFSSTSSTSNVVQRSTRLSHFSTSTSDRLVLGAPSRALSTTTKPWMPLPCVETSIVEVREVVLLEELGELRRPFQRAPRMAIDIHHQHRLVAEGVRREVGGVVLDEVPDDGGQRELADSRPPVPAEIGDDLVLEVDRLGDGLAGFLVRHLPPPVHERDPLPDPLGGGTDLLPFGLGEAAVGFGEDVRGGAFLGFPSRASPP